MLAFGEAAEASVAARLAAAALACMHIRMVSTRLNLHAQTHIQCTSAEIELHMLICRKALARVADAVMQLHEVATRKCMQVAQPHTCRSIGGSNETNKTGTSPGASTDACESTTMCNKKCK